MTTFYQQLSFLAMLLGGKNALLRRSF